MQNQALYNQCAKIGIACNTKVFETAKNGWKVSTTLFKAPESATLQSYKDQGWIGSSDEGGPILLLLKSIILQDLIELNEFEDEEDALNRFLEAQCTILDQHFNRFMTTINQSNEQTVINNFQKIYSEPFVQESYPDVPADLIAQMFSILGRDNISKIFKIFFSDPYEYRKGWPDLTVARNDLLKFIEVKTTDKLHKSQIKTISELLMPIGLSVHVEHIVKSS